MGRTAPAARLKPFALKFFFSNQYLYAHVQRRADGVVRRPTAHARASGRRHAKALAHFSRSHHAALWLQIVAAASTIEKTLRETMKSCTDVAAATKVGAWLCAANPRHSGGAHAPSTAGELLAERSKAAGVEGACRGARARTSSVCRWLL